MASRVGIELAASRCTVVEVQAAGRTPGWTGSRIRAFRSFSYSPENASALTASLRELLSTKQFSRQARVAIWGLRSAHQILSLPPASPTDLEALALREGRQSTALSGEGDLVSGIAVGGAAPGDLGLGRREVSFTAVPAADVRARLQPLVDAGLTVESVVTPALALASIARLRWGTAPDTVTAYVAVNAEATCIALVRNGALLLAREVPWGHQTEAAAPTSGQADQSGFAAKLGAELRRSILFVKQNSKADVGHVCLCGDHPALQSLTAPLIQATGVEVETLDSMEGLDASNIPAPEDDFRQRIGELRVAWAAAADAEAPVNLLPREVRMEHSSRELQGRLLRGVAAVVLILGALYAAAFAWARATDARAAQVRQQIATLEGQVQQFEEGRLGETKARGQKAMLEALASQGPRLTRVLEVLGRSAPQGVVLETASLTPNGPRWRLSVTGTAVGSNPASAQTAFNRFLHLAAGSPYLGQPVRPPTLRVSSGEKPSTTAAPVIQPIDAGLRPRVAESAGTYTPSSWDLDTRRLEGDPYENWWNKPALVNRTPPMNEIEARYRRILNPPTTSSYGRSDGLGTPGAEAAGPKPEVTPTSSLEFAVEFEVAK